MLRHKLIYCALVFALGACASTPRLSYVNPNLARIGNPETLQVRFDKVPAGSQLSINPSKPRVAQTIAVSGENLPLVTVGKTLWRQTSKKSLSVFSTAFKTLTPEFSHVETDDIELWSVGEHKLALITATGSLKLFSFNSPQLILQETRAVKDKPEKISIADDVICLASRDNSLTILRSIMAGKESPAQQLVVPAEIVDISAFESGCAVLTRKQDIFVYFTDVNSIKMATYSLQTAATQILARDGLLHIANTNNGYTLLDIATTGKITWMSSYHKAGNIVRLAVDGNTVSLLADDGTVTLLNVAQADNPTLVCDYLFTGKAKYFGFANDTAFIDDSNTLSAIDFSSSSTPFVSSLGASWGGSRRSDIAGNILYAADWFSGLHIYDIGQDDIKHLATVHTTGSAKGVLVRDHIAYVGDDDQGLQVIDVRNPTTPKILAQLPLPGLAYTMDLQGERLYLAGHHGGFHIIDVTKPTQPKVLGRYDTPGKAWAIRVVNKIAYVADDKSGVLIFDVAKPASIELIGEFNPGGQAEDIIIDYPRAYVAFFDLGFYILDIRNPRQPDVLAQLALPGNSRGIAIQDNIAYVAAWLAGLHAIDITDATKPKWIGNYDTNGYAWGVSVRNKRAYVMDWWGGVKALDISRPSRLTQSASYHGTTRLTDIAVHGQYVFTTAGKRGLQIFDGKNPLNPIWASALETGGEVTTLAVANDVAYVGSDNIIEVIDISDAYRPMQTTALSAPGKIRSLKLFNQQLCALDDKGRIAIYTVGTDGVHSPAMTTELNADRITTNKNACFVSGLGVVHKIYRADNRWHTVELTRSGDTLLAADNNSLFALRNKNEIVILDAVIPHTIKQTITSQAAVTGVIAEDTRVFVLSAGNGIQVYNLVDERYAAGEFYPTRHQIQTGIRKGNALLFSGEAVLVSMELLPHFEITGSAPDFTIKIPANTPQGNYDLVLTAPNREPIRYRNAFKVGFPPPKKQRFTMDDLKKKMQQKNFEGRAPSQ